MSVKKSSKKKKSDDDVLIEVSHVSKKFSRSLKRSMAYGISDISRNMFGIGSNPGKLRKNEFWAVDDVSFKVRRGETLGLIGPNGSGKSTLLKMLNGIYWPDKGKIKIKGKVSALIEVGAGFHPMLTGRENIYINGAILGMSNDEIDSKFNDIVEFADIGDFLDTPVKFYSSGMFVRLGFAIAVHCEPDVLLVDEVLAVGDVGFSVKCYNAISNMKREAAVILVSHNVAQIARYCGSSIYLKTGRIQEYSKNVDFVIEQYMNAFEHNGSISIETMNAKISNYSTSGKLISDTYEINYGEDLIISFDIKIEKEFKKAEINLSLTGPDMSPVVKINNEKGKRMYIENNGKTMHVEVKVPKIQIATKQYYLRILLHEFGTERVLGRYERILSIKVKGNYFSYAPVQYSGEWKIN